MKFADGTKPVEEGMSVVITISIGNNRYQPIEREVEKIGRKLLTLSDGSQWEIDTGLPRWWSYSRIYSSFDGYDRVISEEKTKSLAFDAMRDLRLHDLSFEQAVKILKILKKAPDEP